MSNTQNQVKSSPSNTNTNTIIDMENEDDFDAVPQAQDSQEVETISEAVGDVEESDQQVEPAAPTVDEVQEDNEPVPVQDEDEDKDNEPVPVQAIDPEVVQFVDETLKAPTEEVEETESEETSADDETEDATEDLVGEIAYGSSGGSSLSCNDYSNNGNFAYIVLTLASLGIRIRSVVGRNLKDIFENGDADEAVVTLNARLPKELFTGPKPFIRTLTALSNTIRSREGLGFNLAMLVAPNDKRMKKVTDLDAAYHDGSVVDLVDYVNTSDDISSVLGSDMVIIVSNNNTSLLHFTAVGDALIPNFTYETNSLDLIAPSLGAVARYVEFLSKSQVPVHVKPYSTLRAYGLQRSLTVTEPCEGEDGETFETNYNLAVDQFRETYSIQLMELGKPLSSLINPLFLGNKLLQRANTLGDGEVNRYDLCDASLNRMNAENWSFVGSTVYELTLTFQQSLHIDATIEDEDEEEDEE